MDSMRPSNPSPSMPYRRRMRAVHCLAVGIGGFILLSGPASLSAQAKASEYDVKAAYLFNFGKFVRLSPQAHANHRDTFDICLLGQEPIGKILDGLTANERIDDRLVRIIRVQDASQARACDITYIGSSEGDRVENDLAALAGSDVLTVSDAPRFLTRGGMIQFVMVANHVRFAVDLDAVKRTHLVLSSELLRVASSVSGKPPAEVAP
jgi:hypothetical protein